MKTGNHSRRSVLLAGGAACIIPRVLPAQEREVEGGIGGTGIVGLLTDFGSLIVGGQYVATNSQTVYSDAFGPLSKSNLALGDSLTVEAAGPAGNLVARRVHVTYPVVGQVNAVSGNMAQVNGVEVQMPTRRPAIGIGDRVAVSGVWQGPRVIASRISAARSSQDVISGDVQRTGRGSLVGGIAVRSAALSRQAEGSFASVVGTFDPSAARMAPQSLQSERFVEAAGPLRRLAVEGFLEAAPRAPGFRVSGLGHSFARNLSLASFAGSRTLFTGPYDGRFAASNAVTLPEAEQERRTILRALALRG